MSIKRKTFLTLAFAAAFVTLSIPAYAIPLDCDVVCSCSSACSRKCSIGSFVTTCGDVGEACSTSTLCPCSCGNTIIGTSGNDSLSGSWNNDCIYGGDGDDTLSGGDGNDILYGEAGDDTLTGDAGNDCLYGGPNADSLDGGANYDELRGNGGPDTCTNGELYLSCETIN